MAVSADTDTRANEDEGCNTDQKVITKTKCSTSVFCNASNSDEDAGVHASLPNHQSHQTSPPHAPTSATTPCTSPAAVRLYASLPYLLTHT